MESEAKSNNGESISSPSDEKPSKKKEKSLVRPYIIPPCSSWFNQKEINELEKRLLPEFFDGKSPSKTPEIYLRVC